MHGTNMKNMSGIFEFKGTIIIVTNLKAKKSQDRTRESRNLFSIRMDIIR